MEAVVAQEDRYGSVLVSMEVMSSGKLSLISHTPHTLPLNPISPNLES